MMGLNRGLRLDSDSIIIEGSWGTSDDVVGVDFGPDVEWCTPQVPAPEPAYQKRTDLYFSGPSEFLGTGQDSVSVESVPLGLKSVIRIKAE